MGSFSENLGNAVREGLCQYVGQVEKANSWLRDLNPLVPQAPSGFARGFLCDRPGPHSVPPPFQGGQCPTTYRIKFDWDECGIAKTNTLLFITGPISFSGDTVLVEDDGNCGSETIQRRRWSGISGNGIQLNQQYRTQDPGSLVVTVIRQDGQPDNCGDPEPDIPDFPPAGDTFNIDFDYIDVGGNTVNVSAPVTIFAPVILAPITVVAPVRIDLPDFTLNGTIELAPEFNFNFGPQIPVSTGTPVPPEPEDPQPDSPDEPEACDGTPLLGVAVALAVANDARATSLIQDGDISTLGVPRLGYIYWIASVGGQDLFLPGVELKNRTQFMVAPQEINVTCWRIHTEPGVAVTSQRPVFRPAAPT